MMCWSSSQGLFFRGCLRPPNLQNYQLLGPLLLRLAGRPPQLRIGNPVLFSVIPLTCQCCMLARTPVAVRVPTPHIPQRDDKMFEPAADPDRPVGNCPCHLDIDRKLVTQLPQGEFFSGCLLLSTHSPELSVYNDHFSVCNITLLVSLI